MMFIKKQIILCIILINLIFPQSVEIPNKLANKTQVINIPILMYDINNLEGVTLDIRYNNNIITSKEILIDPFGILGGGYQFFSNINNPGQININIYNASSPTSELFSGNLMIAKIAVELIGEVGGISELTFFDAQINSNYNIIKVDGSIEIILDKLIINATDELESYNDFISLGMCETCIDSWKYGEDEYDLVISATEYINIYFPRSEWIGLIDENNVECCDNDNFASDYRKLSSSNQLISWSLAGETGGFTSEKDIKLSWEDLSMNSSNNFKIYMYIGDDIIIDMKEQTSITISQTKLELIENSNPNVWIKWGACADTENTKLYYFDYDGDGIGSGEGIEYCEGLQPDGLVESFNDDFDIPCDSDLDCLGICEGNNYEDMCGICDNNSSNDCIQDCLGIWGGENAEDECGFCGGNQFDGDVNGDGDPCETECLGTLDCLGLCDGNNYEDECGICNGNNSNCQDINNQCECEGCKDPNACNYNPNFIIADNSICYYSGLYNCNGSCNETIDCNGECGGSAFIDTNCNNICVGGNTGLEACIQDCNGNWGGLSTVDQCGICDNDPLNDNLDKDCNGICFGSAIIDNCGVCILEDNSSCVQGCDGNWSNAGIQIEIDECGVCGGGQNDGDVNNDGDPCETECLGTLDCAGICDGSAVIDINCGTCIGGTTGLEACEKDCSGIWGGIASIDECGICDNDPSNDNYDLDCNNICNPETTEIGILQQQSGYVYGSVFDDCGNCYNLNEVIDCEQDCSGIWGGNHIPTFPCNGEFVCNPDACDLNINFSSIIKEFKINNISPNPFNSQTNIHYQVMEPSLVNLEVYNLRGQKIDILKNKFELPGKYIINWNGTYNPTGIYFVVLYNNKSIIKKKMILLK